jgi:putative acetyltransferase
MISNLVIRPESPNDYATITRVNDLAFGRLAEGRLVENLRKLKEFDPRLSLVAEREGEIIGHIMLFPVQIDASSSCLVSSKDASGEGTRAKPYLSLGPIAVLPKYQKQGIGGQLIESGHRVALELGYTAIVLLGHPAYYPRFGYQPADQWGLTNTWNINGEPWMAIELVKNALSGKAGLVIYPEAFNEAT